MLNTQQVVFPKVPLIRVEGPLAVTQLLETTLLNLINYPSLVATNAARMRLAAGPGKRLLEFGLRRAQGPDGGVSASKYAYIGGFDGTSNVLAGKLSGMAVTGTHAHSFVMSYTSLADLHSTTIVSNAAGQVGESVEFVQRVLEKRTTLGYRTNDGELAAFIAYAQAFPAGLLALVDTYDILSSGVPNFLCVGWVLWELGYKPLGLRIDSGDLAYFSKEIRSVFKEFDRKYAKHEVFGKCNIVASNDINEKVLLQLVTDGHEVDTFGIGTNLVTCQAQPALGCVFKLVEINQQPRIKLSQDIGKMVIPGKKIVYRLFGQDAKPLLDLMTLADEPAPVPGERILVRHAVHETHRAYVQPTSVRPLLQLAFDGTLREANPGHSGIVAEAQITLQDARERCISELALLRADHVRALNATPYKVSVSQKLFDFLHKLWMAEAPIADLK
jgi:nicotinate phosphoribosyltransferase